MLQQRLVYVAVVAVACILQAQGADKYTDENRPYEFGFNIDGEQHRHEKKDENGLIMGEFGFITADGVYHVTVYATDENGNFKILSMKNIRTKPYPTAPGKTATSQTYPGKAAPVKPSQEKKGHSLPFPPSQNPPQTQGPSPQNPPPRAPAAPTRSCSSCSIPTTTTARPQLTDLAVVSRDRENNQFGGRAPGNAQYPQTGQNFPGSQGNFPGSQGNVQDNQGNQYGGQQNYNGGSRPNYQQPGADGNYPQTGDGSLPIYPPLGQEGQQNYPQRGQGEKTNYPQQSQGGPNYPQQNQGRPNYPQQNQGEPNYPQQNQGGSNYPQQNQGGPNYPQQSQGPNHPQQGQGGQQNYPQGGERNPKQFTDFPNGPQGTDGNNTPTKPTLISAQMQIVDKNIDIHHKNPGERDGLPDGLTKDDMTRLLYTFNYTVGFHGHFEEGYTNGDKQGYYYVTGRNGVRTRVDYVADEKGFRPKITQEVLDLLSDDVPKPETEKDDKFGLKGYEFKWLYYPVESNMR